MNVIQAETSRLAQTSPSPVRALFDPSAAVAAVDSLPHRRLRADVEAYAARQWSRAQARGVRRVQRVSLAAPLRAFALITDQSFDYSGQGDVSYWTRAAENMVEGAHALAFALSGFAGAVGEGIFQEALSAQAERLYALTNLGFAGDVSAWSMRTRHLREDIRSVGEILNELSEGAAYEQVPLRAPLEALADFLSSVDASGRGSIQAAMRSSRDVTVLARGVGAAVEALAAAALRPQRGVVLAICRELRGLEYEGVGEGEFWTARARMLGLAVRGFGQALLEAADGFERRAALN